jgi:hypothetical protein
MGKDKKFLDKNTNEFCEIAFILFQNKAQEVKQDTMKCRPEFCYLTCPAIQCCVHSVRPSVYRDAINLWVF